MKAINYPFMVGTLDAKLAMLGWKLFDAGIISQPDIDRVNDMVKEMYADAEMKAREYAAEVEAKYGPGSSH